MTSSPVNTVLDTTILVDALLKSDEKATAAKGALKKCNNIIIHSYAIKELKRGALKNYSYLYNKTKLAPSYSALIAVLSKLSATPQKNKTSTALEALRDFHSSIEKKTDKVKFANVTYAEISNIMLDQMRLWLKAKILRAWKNRYKYGNIRIGKLSCFKEPDVFEASNGLIEVSNRFCSVSDCCLRQKYIGRSSDLKKLLEACKHLPKKRESEKRYQSIRRLERTPKRDMSEEHCIALGDAVFILDCPAGAFVMTTNLQDFVPLAKALEIEVKAPNAV